MSSILRSREWLLVVSVALVVALPRGVGALERSAPVVWLAWLSMPLGAWLGSRRAGWFATVTLGVLSSVVLLLERQPVDWLAFASAEAAFLGVAGSGAALAFALPRHPHGAVAAAWLLSSAACLAPSSRGWLCGEPWSPEIAARLLDLSPTALVLESFGVDWMRHPWVYDPAGTSSIGPELRLAWGRLAGPLSFLVGCGLLFAARRFDATRSNAADPDVAST